MEEEEESSLWFGDSKNFSFSNFLRFFFDSNWYMGTFWLIWGITLSTLPTLFFWVTTNTHPIGVLRLRDLLQWKHQLGHEYLCSRLLFSAAAKIISWFQKNGYVLIPVLWNPKALLQWYSNRPQILLHVNTLFRFIIAGASSTWTVFCW